MQAGAARNAVDCALWDLRAKQAGTSVAELCGLGGLKPEITAETIGIGTPEEMGAHAAELAEQQREDVCRCLRRLLLGRILALCFFQALRVLGPRASFRLLRGLRQSNTLGLLGGFIFVVLADGGHEGAA